MIDSAKPLTVRRQRSGNTVRLCPSRASFFLNGKKCHALAKLIRGQRNAFWEAETGLPRSGEPFTPSDLALLEPLLEWLEAKIQP
jgi:hypothetical protein